MTLLSNPKLQKIWEIIPEARLVGGCVRDYFLGIEPKDIDLAVPYVPEYVITVFKNAGFSVIETGISHGTVTVMVDNEGFEITTLRSDVQTDGRHAEVKWTSDWKKDAERRDFTINAMYLDKEGNLYDYYNGLEDLNNKIVRFVGNADKRIKEDALRILRFFRFSTRFKSFKMNIEAEKAIKNNLDMLNKLSIERIHSEFSKIFSMEGNLWAYKTMKDMGIFSKFFNTFNLKTPKMDFPNYLYFYSYIADDYNFMKKFKASKNEINKVNAVFSFDRIKESNMNEEDLNFYISYMNISKETILMSLFNNNSLDKEKFNEYKKIVDNIKVKTFPLTGQDLIDSGYKEGQMFSEYLKFSKRKWLLSNYSSTKEDLIKKVREKFPM